MDDVFYMKIALEEAKKAYQQGEIPVGAIIVKNNEIIAKAHNSKEIEGIVTRHAEIIAIERASKVLNNWRLLNCTLYVTLFPCPMCAGAINQARFNRIVYGTIPEYAEKQLISSVLNNKNYGAPVEITENVLSEECLALLKKFFVEKR